MSNNDLKMMGLAKVEIAEFNGMTAIRKEPVNLTEGYFYREVLTQSGACAISAPELLASPSDYELWIEYIPNAVDKDETSSSDFMKCLSNLHEAEIQLDDSQLFQFNWSAEDTERAIARFTANQQYIITRAIPSYFERQQALFAPMGPVSGDTNVFNWGRRSNGELVLFDWERFGKASPAMDLAPMIPGLPPVEVIDHYCDRYLRERKTPTFNLAELRQQVLVAIAWLVIEVVNILHDRENAQATKYMDWFNQQFGRWLSKHLAYVES